MTDHDARIARTMTRNPGLTDLKPYPFEHLKALVARVGRSADARLDLSVGEPKFATPAIMLDALTQAAPLAARYPATAGTPELRASFTGWLSRRYGLAPATLDPDRHVLPNLGSREALFAAINCLFDRSDVKRPLVAVPNPGYQIYEGATLLAGGTVTYLPATAATGFVENLDAVPAATWARTQLVVVCSPANPTGAARDTTGWRRVLELADTHGFAVFADECYADVYADESMPPPGLLEVSAALGRPDFERCLVFHSLSKRSNAPGLRSGFVAGDPHLIEAFRRYRTYHGSAMSLVTQAASVVAWNDDAHARANRDRYRANFAGAKLLTDTLAPGSFGAGAFYLWLPTGGDDVGFTERLLARHNVLVLPGSFMGRTIDGENPGAGYVRVALVYDEDTCREAVSRIAATLSE